MSFSVPYTQLAEEGKAVLEPLRSAFERVVLSGRYILGAELAAFEEAFAAYCGVRHAIGTSSGTDALVLALRALDLPPQAEVITVPNSFVATAAAVVRAGATPVFADVRDDGNMDPDSMQAAIGPRTRAVLPVHLAGRPAPMKEIMRIAEARGLIVVEDAAQAVGAKLDGRNVGSFGRAGCFSLNPLKNLYAYGDGGVVTTNDEALAKRLRQARSHGLSDRERCEFFSDNSRLNELQAALLRVHLQRLDAQTEARRRLAFRYNELLAPFGDVPVEGPGERCVYQTYVFRTGQRDALEQHLRENGVEALVHYRTLIPEQPAMRALGETPRPTPNARRYADRILSLPIYPALSAAQQDRVVELIGGFAAARAIGRLRMTGNG
jgi:dTDP-4-amino-4,6-dideoxygalactose transaminase